MHGISRSQEHLINLSSCTGASKYLQGQYLVLDYLNNLVPSCSKLTVVMIGLVWLQSMPSDSYLHLFVGGRVASLGGLAKIRPTFD